MNQGVYPLTASMVNQINRLDQISNNLANADTFGFKQEGTSETTFNWYLKRMQEEQQNPFVESITINNIPKIDTRYTDPLMGPMKMTGNPLDFALNAPDTFFKIQNENGDIVYTRDGAFKNLEKVGDNTYKALVIDDVENFENNDNKILNGTVEQSNVNRVSTMVELIDAHRRFDQSQRAIKTIDELNAGLIEKIGGNTR